MKILAIPDKDVTKSVVGVDRKNETAIPSVPSVRISSVVMDFFYHRDHGGIPTEEYKDVQLKVKFSPNKGATKALSALIAKAK